MRIEKDDFVYLAPAAVKRQLYDDGACRILVMGFRVPSGTQADAPTKVLKANLNEVAKQPVQGHPPSVLYQLLVGDAKSARDKISAGRVLTSLFIMNFAPGEQTFPIITSKRRRFTWSWREKGKWSPAGG